MGLDTTCRGQFIKDPSDKRKAVVAAFRVSIQALALSKHSRDMVLVYGVTQNTSFLTINTPQHANLSSIHSREIYRYDIKHRDGET